MSYSSSNSSSSTMTSAQNSAVSGIMKAPLSQIKPFTVLN